MIVLYLSGPMCGFLDWNYSSLAGFIPLLIAGVVAGSIVVVRGAL